MPVADAKLVERALAGSEDAFADLLRRYERPVFGLVLRMVRDPATAEDLAQEAFLKAFGALASFDRRRKFSSWLFKIAHNATIDHLRRREPSTVPLETAGDELDPLQRLPDAEAPDPEREMTRRRLERTLEDALGSLREEYRAVIVLRHQEGLAYEEIAEICALPIGTVKTHLHRARKALAKRMGELGWGPGKGGGGGADYA